MKLSRIQKRNNLNEVYRFDESGPGGASHFYQIYNEQDIDGRLLLNIQFQKGPRNESTSEMGVLDTDLLEIVRDRLKAFQAGQYACRENACALTHIEEALMWMSKRVEDRYERGVLGTTEK